MKVAWCFRLFRDSHGKSWTPDVHPWGGKALCCKGELAGQAQIGTDEPGLRLLALRWCGGVLDELR